MMCRPRPTCRPTGVVAPTKGVLRIMLLSKLQVAAMAVATLSGTAGLIHQARGAARPKSDEKRLQGTWRVTSVADDGEEAKENGKWTFRGRTVRVRSQSDYLLITLKKERG